MKRPGQPKWFSEEESKLADEWLESGSDMPIDKYILSHASDRFIKEHERHKKAMKGMHFGHVTLPDGDILVYN